MSSTLKYNVKQQKTQDSGNNNKIKSTIHIYVRSKSKVKGNKENSFIQSLAGDMLKNGTSSLPQQ